MIRLNLMEAAELALNPKVAKAGKAVKAAKPQTVKAQVAPTRVPVPGAQRRNAISTFLYLVFFLVAGSVAWLLFVGVPAPLQGVIPAQALSVLGIENSAPDVASVPAPVVPSVDSAPVANVPVPPAEPPQVVAQSAPLARPAVPSNGAVEDIVHTLRPELFIKPTRTEYRELLPIEKVLFQKHAFYHMLGTVYAITPEGVGYLDLAYKAPDYYYVRGMATDPKVQENYLGKLKSASKSFKVVPATTGTPSPEFTAYGTIDFAAPSGKVAENMVANVDLDKTVLGLRDIALGAQVKLTGLDNPLVTSFGTYQRTVLRTSTRADFPSLLRFAEALRNSTLRVGVLQFSSRPTLEGGMSSTVEFVIYSAL